MRQKCSNDKSFIFQMYGRSQHHKSMSISSSLSASTTNDSTSAVSRSRATGIISDANESNMHQKSLANKMRGIGKKISRFRSRSAERVSQRDRTSSPERQEITDIYDTSKEDSTSAVYSSRLQDKTSGAHTVITFR